LPANFRRCRSNLFGKSKPGGHYSEIQKWRKQREISYGGGRMNQAISQALAGLFAIALTLSASAEVKTGIDEEAKLPFWQWSEQGVSIRLVQRLPDQTRAFFIGRGFDTLAADAIGTGCVFQTVFRNSGDSPLDYDLSEWTVQQANNSSSMILKEDWDKKWQALNLSQSTRIAFKWSFLPNRQHFEPGDYNWGMTSYGLPPGHRFDLNLVLYIDGKKTTGKIENIECPPDKEI